jgi:hypothetical protein
MAVKGQQYDTLSPSSQRALGFAEAAARHRTGGPHAVVEPADLLIGVLLAHPDTEGEGRVLLTHFGLTARDVLPENYPPVTAEDLRQHAAGISFDPPPPIPGVKSSFGICLAACCMSRRRLIFTRGSRSS